MDYEKAQELLKGTKFGIEDRIQEVIENIKAIKGQDYADAVRFVSGLAHTAKLINVGTQAAPPEVQRAIAMQFAQVGAGGSSLMLKLMGLSEDDCQEVLKLADSIGSIIDGQMDILNNELMKLRGERDDD